MKFLKWAALLCFVVAFIESISPLIALDMNLIALGLAFWVASELNA